MSHLLGLSEQRLEELRLAWNTMHALKKIKTASMELADFQAVLKCLGIELSKKENKALLQEYNIRGCFAFEDLVHIGSVVWTEEFLEESLLVGLQQLDPGKTGLIRVTDLRQYLYKLGVGVRLSLEEIDTFLQIFEEVKTGFLPVDKIVLRYSSAFLKFINMCYKTPGRLNKQRQKFN